MFKNRRVFQVQDSNPLKSREQFFGFGMGYLLVTLFMQCNQVAFCVTPPKLFRLDMMQFNLIFCFQPLFTNKTFEITFLNDGKSTFVPLWMRFHALPPTFFKIFCIFWQIWVCILHHDMSTDRGVPNVIYEELFVSILTIKYPISTVDSFEVQIFNVLQR